LFFVFLSGFNMAIKRALISVSDKNRIVDLARRLQHLGVEILSTGGTAKLLYENDIKLIEVSDYTGFPEMMDGRLKTLHPKIHGGILGRRGIDDTIMAEHGMAPIDLVVVNLYPFEQTVADPQCTLAAAIENIDIGGPAMLRAAAKNWQHTTIVTCPTQYEAVLVELEKTSVLSERTRFQLAVQAFNLVANYDAAISGYLSALQQDGTRAEFSGQLNSRFVKLQDLRYGENPHQKAALYRDLHPAPGTLATFNQLQGKPLSFNNLADADAAWECVRQFTTPACVIVKHANPCGVALSHSLAEAYRRAYATDPSAAFGGIIALNQTLDSSTAEIIIANQFVEVVIAPAVNEDALAVLSAKGNIRVLQIPPGEGSNSQDVRRVGSGLLIQTADNYNVKRADLRKVTRRAPSETELADLLFVFQVAKFVKSNAIVYGKEGRTLGIGAGQMSRVDSARIGVLKAKDAGLSLAGCVMASDAFFPFRDGLDAAAEAGVRAVIQPGGSMRDQEVIDAANAHDIAMVFTGVRHFRH
jgi:phosphoribosylaminoimidazolecarboxamide formyltransferase/IMP cyclohydrolase